MFYHQTLHKKGDTKNKNKNLEILLIKIIIHY